MDKDKIRRTLIDAFVAGQMSTEPVKYWFAGESVSDGKMLYLILADSKESAKDCFPEILRVCNIYQLNWFSCQV